MPWPATAVVITHMHEMGLKTWSFSQGSSRVICKELVEKKRLSCWAVRPSISRRGEGVPGSKRKCADDVNTGLQLAL